MYTRLLTFLFSLMFVPGLYAQNTMKERYKGNSWVENISRPNRITAGLQNVHLALWASHGRYFDTNAGLWKWQRPILFGTTEDLYTQTIVVPYLIPMLESAGAVVFTPRERDWQQNEVIVDNDGSSSSYKEENIKKKWTTASVPGFAFHQGDYRDGENPFAAGTARQIKSRKRSSKLSSASYQPVLPKEGKYAVYVSYQTQKKSVDDAEYIVYHKGQETHVRVNQQMGSGTWVYLGTFDFDKGCNSYNRVVLTNHSRRKGIVTTDAVRFGGGMGNIQRGGTISHLPRSLEGARYYAQWAGAPYSVVSKSSGGNDYNDDINVRSLMTNWLAGGSVYLPDADGKNVPIELALAVHSDAGVKNDGSLVGTLGICTTQQGDSPLAGGLQRGVSKTLAEQLVNNLKRDIEQTFYTSWTTRSVWDRNYSETRLPRVPSVILETLSHQNFPDIRLGQDPNFKFTLARSVYKTLLKYEAGLHRESYVVQPLAPRNFRIEFISKSKIRIRWDEAKDPLEPTAKPTSYNLYTSTGTSGFDNGMNIRSSSFDMELEPDVLYSFRLTACNQGGESFPTEVLSAYRAKDPRGTVLIINGFHRLSSPAQINSNTEQGFDLESDPGISYGPTTGWNGRQSNFDKAQMGKEGAGALGYGGNELAGKIIAGNDFNYVRAHAEAIQTMKKYNIVSCSSTAVESAQVSLSQYDLVDLALGLEKDDGHSLIRYKCFRPSMQHQISEYLRRKGKLLVSGAYLASDMNTDAESKWLSETLKIAYAGAEQNGYQPSVEGLGLRFDVYRTMNEEHYGAYFPDILTPVGSAFATMTYSSGGNAAVAYKGNDYSTFTMAFPWECIKDKDMRNKIMRGIVAYLLK
ncbi:golvesin C-terminal-like domain-containing protein [Prevotella dentasini]|uniref:golvesin C-terminal-like domain-containing protein n=1 Tax=Prevotella dentasini TaxID=589537 RepID=UPI000468BEBE